MRWLKVVVVVVVMLSGSSIAASADNKAPSPSSKPVSSSGSPTPAAPTKNAATAKAVKKTGAKKSGLMTGAEAVTLVSNLPEVKKWAEGIRKLKRKDVSAAIDLDRTEGDIHVVHVYENVMDSPDSGHTATFNWYNVNAKTRKISKEF